MDINIGQMIFTAASYRNTNVGMVAQAIGMSPSSLYKKISRNTLKPGELSKIAKVLGAEYICYYSFHDGSKIGTLEKNIHKKNQFNSK